MDHQLDRPVGWNPWPVHSGPSDILRKWAMTIRHADAAHVSSFSSPVCFDSFFRSFCSCYISLIYLFIRLLMFLLLFNVNMVNWVVAMWGVSVFLNQKPRPPCRLGKHLLRHRSPKKEHQDTQEPCQQHTRCDKVFWSSPI